MIPPGAPESGRRGVFQIRAAQQNLNLNLGLRRCIARFAPSQYWRGLRLWVDAGMARYRTAAVAALPKGNGVAHRSGGCSHAQYWLFLAQPWCNRGRRLLSSPSSRRLRRCGSRRFDCHGAVRKDAWRNPGDRKRHSRWACFLRLHCSRLSPVWKRNSNSRRSDSPQGQEKFTYGGV